MTASAEDIGFWDWASREPGRLALVDPAERRVTFGELRVACNQVANGLLDMGLKPGDGVAAIFPNSPEFYEVLLAALQIGLYFTPINHYLAAPEIAYVLIDCEAKALFSHQQYGESTLKALAAVPPKATADVPTNPDPVIDTEVPAGPSAGVSPATCGTW